MALWKEYVEPIVPPFPEDILSLVTSVMVPPTRDEIEPPDTLVDSIDIVLAIDASDSKQQKAPCLPTLASWDNFLPDIASLFMESHN